MTIKEFGEDAEVEYKLTVSVNDEPAITIVAGSEELMLEKLRTVDQAVKDELYKQYEELPDDSGQDEDSLMQQRSDEQDDIINRDPEPNWQD